MTLAVSQLAGFGAGGNFISLGADFEGSNDYMSIASLTGAADGKVGTVSFWYTLDGGDGAIINAIAGNQTTNFKGVWVERKADNKFEFRVHITGVNTETGKATSTNTFTADAGVWHHYMASWDLANTTVHQYIDGTAEEATVVQDDNTVDVTTNYSIGSRVTPSNYWNGGLAEFYMAFEYLDISSAAVRAKFAVNGKPVYLGPDGSFPTGTQPIVYQRIAQGAAATTFATNVGSGGNWTDQGGLTLTSTNPTG